MLQFYLSMMNSGEDKALVEFLYNEYKQLMFKTAYAILRNRESAEENIKALSPALRDIAYLSFVENCSAGEISELLDMKINTVHSSISRARKIISRKHTENNQ